MIELIVKNRKEAMEKLKDLPRNVEEIYINIRPSISVITFMLENFPNLKKIACPPSLYLQVSSKVKRSLENVGVELVPGDNPVGRPKKYDEEFMRELYQKYLQGASVKRLSEETGIPKRTIYFYINKFSR